MTTPRGFFLAPDPQAPASLALPASGAEELLERQLRDAERRGEALLERRLRERRCAVLEYAI